NYLNNGLNNMIGQYNHTGQYLEGPEIYKSAFKPVHSIPSMAIDQNMLLNNINGLDLSSAIRASIDGSLDSLAYGAYSGQGFNPISTIGSQSVQFNPLIPGPSLLGYPFNPMYSMPSTSRETDRIDDEVAINSHAHNPKENEYEPLVEQPNTEEASEQQAIVESNSDENASNKKRKSVIQTIGQKRKAREIEIESDSSIDVLELPPTLENKRERREEDASKEMADIICLAEEAEDIEKNNEELVHTNKPQLSIGAEKKEKKLNHYNILLWNNKRLDNKRRTSYKGHHITVYKHHCAGFISNAPQEIIANFYQEKIKKEIEKFSSQIASLIEQNPFWYFVASRTKNINIRYKDLFGLKHLLSSKDSPRHKEMLMNLEGYYPGVVDDMIEYTRKHRPLRASQESPSSKWRETLGDIYVRKSLDLNYKMVQGQDKNSQVEEKYSLLAEALRMIQVLPEVYQDFSTIDKIFIKGTEISENPNINKKNHQVLLSLRKLVRKTAEDNKIIEDEYENIHSALESIYEKDPQKEPTVAELYKKLYMILADFYKKALVFESANYVLAGKCVIKHQRYIACKASLGLVSENSKNFVRAYDHFYSFNMNKWDVSVDVKPHYHIYYVDNTTHQLRMLCMPKYKEEGSGEEHYLHTINSIVNHIKMIYGIRIKTDVIHPFKVKKGTRKWTYIEKKDRNKTVKDLEEYKVVFYHIVENLETTKFAFAEFWSLNSLKKDTICIPLFLTPLMQSAVELGPFKKKKGYAEINPVEFKDRVADVYKFNSVYKHPKYSDVHRYYSNLYILPDEEKKGSPECYVMDYQTHRQPDNSIKVTWNVRMPRSVNEYTHYMPEKSSREKESKKKFNNFISVLESREYNKDSELEGVWLRNGSIEDKELENQAKTLHTWHASIEEVKYETRLKNLEIIKKKIKKAEEEFAIAEEKQANLIALSKRSDAMKAENEKKIANITSTKSKAKVKLEVLQKELYKAMSEKPDDEAEFIIFRNMNKSKSNLGAHNEILDALISSYNH
ncbi:hypothetical protein NEMIN01_2176, partial [Nematocida minor]|uniref:uncharacterized protein n=1 Tax=Nematocida minor TaxID=1912983 RepID=UPI00221F4645